MSGLPAVARPGPGPGLMVGPVEFTVEEGPNPGPINQKIRKDSPYPPEKGISPQWMAVIAAGCAIGGLLLLKNLVTD